MDKHKYIDIPNFLPFRLEMGDVRSPVTVRLIQYVVGGHFHTPVRAMLSIRRYGGIVRARHVAYYFSRELTTLSFTTIARLFKKDHATIMYGCRKIEKMIATDPKFGLEIETIRAKIMEAR